MIYRQLQTKDGRRSYLEVGAGEPIVLLHCSAGAGSAWMPVIDRLGPGFRALAPDLLGYGRSAPWRRGVTLQPDSELAVVEALVDAIGRPVHLVGHSYGGTVAINAARRFAQQAASLTLIEPVAFHLLRRADEPEGWREIARLAERHLTLVGAGRDAEAAEAFTTYWMGRSAWQQVPEAAREGIVRTMPKVAAEWQLMFAVEDDLETVAQIDAPTLLICGGRTRAPARRVVEVLRSALPHARHLEIADAGHMSPVTHPAAVADAIRGQVASINRGGDRQRKARPSNECRGDAR
jgi:pimeloyl-ACP methyl ester carboxylesterase